MEMTRLNFALPKEYKELLEKISKEEMTTSSNTLRQILKKEFQQRGLI